MKEKVDIALKIKERVLIRNITLFSLDKLPEEIYNKLPHLKRNFLLLYDQKLHKPEIDILSPRKILIKKNKELPTFQKGDLCLLILPLSKARYVFQVKITEENEDGFIGEFVDPRSDERIAIKSNIPVFVSFITPKFVQTILNYLGYQLLRETNFSPDSYQDLREIHLYDLIINENHNIDEEFKKLIQKTFLVGELVNISKGGLSVRTKGRINITDEFGVFYLKFDIHLKAKSFKFALFAHLRNISFKEDFTYLHLAFLSSLKREFWEVLKEELLKVSGE
ncbi:MAG: hypothetical protein C0197_02345 [Caldimicrobium thiodismutans]|jgi:hypothetical protein|uniref:PilZ domain-containing protein n=1 Tax=Caldimicrobium thiodismutans TaxID=1653476 RepID=A0A2N7PKF2_9BACT|nr:MAG: hypothetical protein C0197_02345 [Caldimicrobium thiodismutans]